MKTTALLITILFAFSVQAQVYQLPEVDTAPVFAKGKMTSDNFLSYYLQYPQSDFDQGIEGAVTLEFVVDSTGMVGEVSVKNGLTPSLDAEALRVAALFPFYSPAQKNGQDVAVKVLFPVKFKLTNSKVVADSAPAAVVSSSNGPKSPLYVVNDKVLQKDENINPADIKKIRVVKGKKATDLYGMRAKDGLILIETR